MFRHPQWQEVHLPHEYTYLVVQSVSIVSRAAFDTEIVNCYVFSNSVYTRALGTGPTCCLYISIIISHEDVDINTEIDRDIIQVIFICINLVD